MAALYTGAWDRGGPDTLPPGIYDMRETEAEIRTATSVGGGQDLLGHRLWRPRLRLCGSIEEVELEGMGLAAGAYEYMPLTWPR